MRKLVGRRSGEVENASDGTRHGTGNLKISLDSSQNALSNEHHVEYSRHCFSGIKFEFKVGRTLEKYSTVRA